MPQNKYLMRYQIGKVADLLKTGGRQFYFSRVFRRYMGILPSHYMNGGRANTGKENAT